MLIKSVKIEKFRKFVEFSIDFSPNITVIKGANAVGKTTIIEAINCLSTIKSFRTNNNVELINEKFDYFYLETVISTKTNYNLVSFYCDKNIKRVKINDKIVKKLSEYIGLFNVVCFSSLDFLKLKGSSSNRREIFELVLCQISKEYLEACNCYKKFLKDRNTLLKSLCLENRNDLIVLLDVINEQLILYGNKIISFRKHFIEKISLFSNKIHYDISNRQEDFCVNYAPCSKMLSKEEYSSKLEEDIKRGYTTIGPHRDDYIFLINGKNVATFGSQGQQRNALLSVKLAIADLIFETKKEAPTLLLDDVFSELDKNRQNALVNYLICKYQTIITTASISDLDKKLLNNAFVVELDKRSE